MKSSSFLCIIFPSPPRFYSNNKKNTYRCLANRWRCIHIQRPMENFQQCMARIKMYKTQTRKTQRPYRILSLRFQNQPSKKKMESTQTLSENAQINHIQQQWLEAKCGAKEPSSWFFSSFIFFLLRAVSPRFRLCKVLSWHGHNPRAKSAHV